MSEEMNKEAEVQEEAVDIPVTDGSEEEAADTAQTAEEETSEEPAQTEETEQSDQEAESQKEPETKTKTSFFGKKNNKEESFNDFDADEDKKFQPSASSKVTPMRPAAKHGGNMEVCVVKPTSVDDSREITETLLAGRTVILNLEGMDLEIAQRIIDFISGAAFAISGNLQKISSYIFLVTPTNVDISGDLQDLLSGSMETPSVRGRY